MTRTQRRRAQRKRAKKRMNNYADNVSLIWRDINYFVSPKTTNSLGTWELTCVHEEKEERETVMYTENEGKMRYLLTRLQRIYWSKDCDLERQYGLREDDPPINGADMVKRIMAGKYVLEDDCILWRDPSIKKDQETYKAKIPMLQKLYQDAQDQITIIDPKDGLKVLQDFEATTIQ